MAPRPKFKHKRKPLVRYISPFGSPAWMTEDQAMVLLNEDNAVYEHYYAAGVLDVVLTKEQRRVGYPRIER